MKSKYGTILHFAVGDHKYNIDNYLLTKASSNEMNSYNRFLRESYEPLGFLNHELDKFLPREATNCYFLHYLNDPVGICSLTPVKGIDSVYHKNIEYLKYKHSAASMLEINNVVIAKHLRGSIGVALILYKAVKEVIAREMDMLVGLTRYQTLRYFVEFGATPVYHKPLHLLGKEELNDYIVYYDVKVPEAKSYLEQRFVRFLYQLSVMNRIRKDINTRKKTGIKSMSYP